MKGNAISPDYCNPAHGLHLLDRGHGIDAWTAHGTLEDPYLVGHEPNLLTCFKSSPPRRKEVFACKRRAPLVSCVGIYSAAHSSAPLSLLRLQTNFEASLSLALFFFSINASSCKSSTIHPHLRCCSGYSIPYRESQPPRHTRSHTNSSSTASCAALHLQSDRVNELQGLIIAFS